MFLEGWVFTKLSSASILIKFLSSTPHSIAVFVDHAYNFAILTRMQQQFIVMPSNISRFYIREPMLEHCFINY